MNAIPHVVVVGGGFAGLETAFYLRHKLGDQVNLTLISDQDHFLFKPNMIYIPFGEDPEKLKTNLARPTKRKDIRLVVDEAKEIDPDSRRVALSNGSVEYDYLVVATGAATNPGEVPGLEANAIIPWTASELRRLGGRLELMAQKAHEGEVRRLLFLVPPNNQYSGPLYEIALMAETWLEKQKARDMVNISWVTYEDRYIEAFGPRLDPVVSREFEERAIHGYKGLKATRVEPEGVYFENESLFEYDLLVGFPPFVAQERYGGLPVDNRGFIQVDSDSRRVAGHPYVFAVGDTADFPIKQAFLALLQGDAAAEHIAADISGKEAPPEARFTPVSMWIMEQMNKATFAQVPLKYTGDPMKPVAVDEAHEGTYRIGVSPLWRMGKKVLGLYMPWRFAAGEPFHAGFAWEAMELGLKAMSRVMAR